MPADDTAFYATLPFRVVGTPIVFIGQFLTRSAFDVPPRGATTTKSGPGADGAPSPEQVREQQLLGQLQRIAAGDAGDGGEWFADFDQKAHVTWTAALNTACDAALAHGNGYGRLQLYDFLRRHRLPPWLRDPLAGLRDPDPVVRFHELEHLSANVEVPADLRQRLREDPNEVVRMLARSRLR